LNLTKFETYYPEKRPFFLEGIDIVSFNFETQTQALYDGFNFNGTAGVLFRALPQLDLEILPTAS
jgi:hypothetical protein